MKPFSHNHCRPAVAILAMSLIELMVTIALAAIVLAMVATLYVFTLRSFGAMNNYTEMDARSRQAMDSMLKEIRQATQLVGFQTNGPNRWLKLTNAFQGTLVKYSWDQASGVMLSQKTGQPAYTNLTGCDDWTFSFYLRYPDTNGNFYPTTNNTLCKLINMSWKCSRTNLRKKINTESMVTAQVVLRN